MKAKAVAKVIKTIVISKVMRVVRLSRCHLKLMNWEWCFGVFGGAGTGVSSAGVMIGFWKLAGSGNWSLCSVGSESKWGTLGLDKSLTGVSFLLPPPKKSFCICLIVAAPRVKHEFFSTISKSLLRAVVCHLSHRLFRRKL